MLASPRPVVFKCVVSPSFLFACGGTTTDATDRRGVQNATGGAGALGGDAGESSGGASGGGGASGAGGFILRPPSLHRSSADACSHDRGPGDFDPFNPSDGGSSCTKDADCTAGENGRCRECREELGISFLSIPRSGGLGLVLR